MNLKQYHTYLYVLIVALVAGMVFIGSRVAQLRKDLGRYSQVCPHLRDRLCLDWHMLSSTEQSKDLAVIDVHDRAPEILACLDVDQFTMGQFDNAEKAHQLDGMRALLAKAITNLPVEGASTSGYWDECR